MAAKTVDVHLVVGSSTKPVTIHANVGSSLKEVYESYVEGRNYGEATSVTMNYAHIQDGMNLILAPEHAGKTFQIKAPKLRSATASAASSPGSRTPHGRTTATTQGDSAAEAEAASAAPAASAAQSASAASPACGQQSAPQQGSAPASDSLTSLLAELVSGAGLTERSESKFNVPVLLMVPMLEEANIIDDLVKTMPGWTTRLHKLGSLAFVAMDYKKVVKILMYVCVSMYNLPMYEATQHALKLVDPKVTILCGLAGSLDSKKAPVGTIVIPTEVKKCDINSMSDIKDEALLAAVQALNGQRNATDSTKSSVIAIDAEFRSTSCTVDRPLRSDFITTVNREKDALVKMVQEDINEFDKSAFAKVKDKVNFTKVAAEQPMVAGDAVVKSLAVSRILLRHIAADAVAVAMEDYGFMSAAGKRGLIVRAISDDGSPNKAAFDKVFRGPEENKKLKAIRWAVVRRAARMIMVYASKM